MLSKVPSVQVTTRILIVYDVKMSGYCATAPPALRPGDLAKKLEAAFFARKALVRNDNLCVLDGRQPLNGSAINAALRAAMVRSKVTFTVGSFHISYPEDEVLQNQLEVAYGAIGNAHVLRQPNKHYPGTTKGRPQEN